MPSPLGRRGGTAIVFAALVAILFATWFPFDFVVLGGPIDAVRRVNLDFEGVWVWEDVPRNIVLFVPLGFGVAVWAGSHGWGTRAVLATATACGFGVSTVVELVQAEMLERFASANDVLANTVGAAVGAAISVRWGGAIAAWTRRVRRRAARAPEVVLAAIALVPAVLLLLATAVLPGGAGLPWDASYRLALGNGVTGEAPWSGTIESVVVTDGSSRDVTDGGSLDGTDGGSPDRADNRSPDDADDRSLDDADAGGAVPVFSFDADDAASSGLEWRDGEGAVSEDGVVVGADGWLISEGPVSEVSEAVAAADEVGVVAVVRAASSEQPWPAPILSIAGDTFHRNVTIGQEGESLLVRLRTDATGPDGTPPQLAVPGVFANDAAHVVAVTSDGASIEVSVDGDASSMRLEPEANVLMRLLPVGTDDIRISTIGPTALVLSFHALLLVPWGIYLACRRPRPTRWALVALGLVVPVLVELGLWLVAAPGTWVPSMILLGLAACAAGAVTVVVFRAVAPARGASVRR